MKTLYSKDECALDSLSVKEWARQNKVELFTSPSFKMENSDTTWYVFRMMEDSKFYDLDMPFGIVE